MTEPTDEAARPAPPPPNKPRSLAAEVGVIVLGVLIALIAQQTAQWLDWRGQAAEARKSLRGDELRLVGWAGEREAMSPCIDRRLTELTAIVQAASASGRLPPLAATAIPPRRAWTLRTWETLTSSELLSHMPRQEVRHIASLALYLESVRPMRDIEIANWSRLRALAGPGRAFGEGEAAQMLAVLSNARDYAAYMRSNAIELAQISRDTGLLSRAELEETWRKGFAIGQKVKVCEPLGAPGSPRPTQGSNLTDPPRPPWTMTPRE
ncbi:MAG: hypothetical protein JWO33_2452 [Caulobacteraceae bacterium]|nr:hypothetical protein [Caulobacteraceae bacterium]